jgi:uncharacterized protein YjbJ (UPF0337 family)
MTHQADGIRRPFFHGRADFRGTRCARPAFTPGKFIIMRRSTEAMNWDEIKGNWKQIKGKAQQQWGKLTDDDLQVAEGHREELVGRVQERYGVARDEAERQVSEWERGL